MSTALTRFFFRSPWQPVSTRTVIQWWESRRLMYNVAVGIAGTISLSALAIAEIVGRHQLPDIPLFPIVVYAVLANIMYSFGPIADTIISRRWGAPYTAVGPALFRYGFVFSIGLTLLPIPVALIDLTVSIAKMIF